MTVTRISADATPTRNDLRLAVLAQWIAAGLGLVRDARGLVGGAVALWRLAQAVRLALLLARRLAETGGVSQARAPGSAPDLAWPVHDASAHAAALAELAAALSIAADIPQPRPLAAWDREPSGSLMPQTARPCRARASLKARGPRVRPHGRRPLRPPGPARAFRRRWRTPGAQETTLTPIAPWRSGATRWREA